MLFRSAAATDETRGLFDADRLALLDEDAVLVNVARGALVDTDAVVEALAAGRLHGYGTDVTDPEPLPEGHPLWTEERALITPHTADTPEMCIPLLHARVERNLRARAAGDDRIVLVENGENLGFARGNNRGIEAATGEFVLLLNNDTFLAPGALLAMVRHLQRNPELGIVGPMTNNIGNEARIEIAYADMDQMARAARDHGIASIAVYSDPDADALHVAVADEAFHLPGASSADTYLKIDAVLDVARRAGADAVHPGYGFLSENADFAQAVIDAGMTWIGPSPDAIRALGDKITARSLAQQAGAPLVPGSDGPVPDAAAARAFAEEHGLPIAIKAAFGGGGAHAGAKTTGIHEVGVGREVVLDIVEGLNGGSGFGPGGCEGGGLRLGRGVKRVGNIGPAERGEACCAEGSGRGRRRVLIELGRRLGLRGTTAEQRQRTDDDRQPGTGHWECSR
mgnify:CR=1 FL=1